MHGGFISVFSVMSLEIYRDILRYVDEGPLYGFPNLSILAGAIFTDIVTIHYIYHNI